MSSDPSAKRPHRSVRVGKYEVVTHIATGGMGAVYKAIDTVLKREVALKVLPPDMASKPNALERFRREARNAAKLRHENIVTIYEFSQTGKTFYLAMEFIDGIDLQEYINRKGRLDPEEAHRIAIQTAQALEHAHQQGIVHRDIKPSNFLVVRKRDKLIVKMSDFGLARETSDEEARVTRDGTTVGTVDYMAPEQARDCGKADCRSDIYSLGCTLFHMLTGKAPFAEGSIPERLYKHAHDEAPDVRQLNPRVSEAFCAVVRRMLAKDPDQRYPTPKALLKDLVHLESATGSISAPDVLAGLARAEGEAEPAAETTNSRRPLSTERAIRPPVPPPRQPRRGEAPPPELLDVPAEKESSQRGVWTWLGIGGIVALVLAIVGIVLASREWTPAPDTRTVFPRSSVPEAADTSRNLSGDTHPGGLSTGTQKGPSAPVKVDWPPLYQPLALNKDALTKDFLGPWMGQTDPGPDVPVLHVTPKPSGRGSFGTLAAACEAAPTNRLTVIEIDDNGPLFLSPIAVADRVLCIRAGKDRRPLLVWDKPSAAKEGASFLTLTRGSVTLDRLDLAVKWPDLAAVSHPNLVRVIDGDLFARDCTFSLSGPQPAHLGAVRFERSDASGLPRTVGSRCRLSRCVARGPGMVALDLDSAGADVLLDGCLFVGTDQPLVQVAGRNLSPAVLRVLRSTLAADQTIFQIRPATFSDNQPELHVRTWDALLTRGGDKPGGQMVVISGGGRPTRMKWQATNCLYAGWGSLLAGDEDRADRLTAWQKIWQRSEGDMMIGKQWPALVHSDPAEVVVKEYEPVAGPPVGYAATSGSGPLGCDLAALPPARTNWLALIRREGLADKTHKPEAPAR